MRAVDGRVGRQAAGSPGTSAAAPTAPRARSSPSSGRSSRCGPLHLGLRAEVVDRKGACRGRSSAPWTCRPPRNGETRTGQRRLAGEALPLFEAQGVRTEHHVALGGNCCDARRCGASGRRPSRPAPSCPDATGHYAGARRPRPARGLAAPTPSGINSRAGILVARLRFIKHRLDPDSRLSGRFPRNTGLRSHGSGHGPPRHSRRRHVARHCVRILAAGPRSVRLRRLPRPRRTWHEPGTAAAQYRPPIGVSLQS